MKEKYSKYLPTKKFLIILSVLVVLGVIIFVIFFMSSGGEIFSTTNKKNLVPLKVANQSVTDLIQKDSDGDGIPDWEEDLWGTDKNKKITFNNTPDATYIENRKKELNIDESVTANDKNLTETDKFAREFFVSYSAMKSSGQVDKNAINSFSSALGEKVANPNLLDRYTASDIKLDNNDTAVSRQAYYNTIKKIFKTYQTAGIGDELDIISNKITLDSANNPNSSAKLIAIANAYQDFAKKIITDVKVPEGLADYHLRIANSSNNTGISVSNMEKVMDDPVVGLSGISQYQKYSNDLVAAVGDLETALTK